MKRIMYCFLIKGLLCLCIFFILGILCKCNYRYRDVIIDSLYYDYLDFSRVKVFYNKYLGGVFPIENVSINGLEPVFNEKLVYKNASSYKDGVSLEVSYNYLVPVINKGIVVYVGKKDDYGNVVIVEGENDLDIWYGNLCNIMVNIYDVVDSGSYLGESCDNKISLVYTKKNEILDYRDYLE